MKQLPQNIFYSPVRICLLGFNEKIDPDPTSSPQRPHRIVVWYATADFTDAPANYWDNLHVRALDSFSISTGNSIPAGYYRHTGKILPVGLWQRVEHS